MRIREEIPNSLFKGFCAIALGLWAGDHKIILSYLLFGMGFSWLALILAEVAGVVTIIRPSDSKPEEHEEVNLVLQYIHAEADYTEWKRSSLY
jgi:hypothetical protein